MQLVLNNKLCEIYFLDLIFNVIITVAHYCMYKVFFIKLQVSISKIWLFFPVPIINIKIRK